MCVFRLKEYHVPNKIKKKNPHIENCKTTEHSNKGKNSQKKPERDKQIACKGTMQVIIQSHDQT